jgi:hypothetical protein
MPVYEVLSSDTVSFEEIQIPIYAAIGNDAVAAALDKATLIAGFAPFVSAEGAPVNWFPRFVAPSGPAVPLTTHACHP